MSYDDPIWGVIKASFFETVSPFVIFLDSPSTSLRVVSPSTLLRTVSLSNGLSNHGSRPTPYRVRGRLAGLARSKIPTPWAGNDGFVE